MESRAWGAYRLPVPGADAFVIGASPRRSDRFAIGVFAEQLGLVGSLGGLPSFKGSLVAPDAPAHTREFVGEGDGGDVEAAATLDGEGPGPQVVGHLCDGASAKRGASSVDEHHA